MMVGNSRKKCPITFSESPQFFSLVDYRNNYFTSDDPNKIIEFYNGFENRDQLIQWMKERPKGVANIHEVEGDKDIIVVIPTADFNGKYAKECRENIFKGLHIIFVESGEVPDPYFNYAHNCNVGIRKAMEYNPKWVVVSNDDIASAAPSQVLLSELSKINDSNVDCVFTINGNKTKIKTSICKFNTLGLIIYSILIHTPFNKLIGQNYRGALVIAEIKRGLHDNYIIIRDKKRFIEIFFKKLYTFDNIESFGIFSGKFIKNNGIKIFDETYINGYEDEEISIIISKNPDKTAFINYNMRAIEGGTFGSDLRRGLRYIASDSYIQYKIENELLIALHSSPV